MSTYAIKADKFSLPAGPQLGGYLMVEDGVFGAWQADEPACVASDPIRRLAASAESCVFGKQSLGPLHCGPPPLPGQAGSRTRGHPFSRSYGAIVPSSLTMVDPIASVCSTHPPVSVCGTGAHAPA